VPDSNPAGVVYGILTIGALLAAESDRHESYPEALGSAAVALALYWLAHSYADLLGDRLAHQRHLSLSALWHTILHDRAIARGAGVPLLALLICWAIGATQATAITAALWTSIASLVVFEILAGLRARVKPAELVLEGCVGATMGLAIFALKIILH
jgi:hypothetical protein